MSQDPLDPGYLPEADGSTLGSTPGRGQDFGADLYALYRSGRLFLPDVANHYAAAVSGLDVADYVVTQLSADRPGEASLRKIGTMLVDVQDAMRETAINLHLAGEALVDIADRYVRTDEAAAEQFRAYKTDRLGDPSDFADPPAPFRVSPKES